MAKQTINIGTADRGDGDPIRTAFNKVNANFTELYTALGLGDASLNLGSFEFTNNVMTTTDSSAVIIDQNVTITNELTMQGDIVPNLAGEHNLGSAAKPWGSLYVSGSTIYIGGTALAVNQSGQLTVGGVAANTSDRLINATDKIVLNEEGATRLSMYLNNVEKSRIQINGNDLLLSSLAGGVVLAATDGVGGEWRFKTNGNLESTGGNFLSAAEIPAVFGSLNSTSTGASSGTVTLKSGIGNVDGGSIYIEAGTGGSGNDGEVTIRTGSGPHEWLFDNGGNLTIPGEVRHDTTNNWLDLNLAGGNVGLASQTGVVGIYADYAGGPYTWLFKDNGSIQFPDMSLQTTAYPGPQTTLDGDVTGSVFADDSTIMVDGVNGVLRANVNVPNTWTVTTGNKTWSFIYGDVSEGTIPIFEFPGSLQASQSQTGIYAPADDLSGNWGMSIDAANSPYSVDIGEIGGSNFWRFDGNGGITFPDASVQTTAYTGVADIARNIENEGDVSITVNLTDSTKRIWRFGEDGELTFPDGPNGSINLKGEGTVRNYNGNINLVSNNFAQLQWTTPTGVNEADPNQTNEPLNWLYVDTAGIWIETNKNVGGGGNNRIWRFNNDGVFSLPGGGYANDEYDIFSANSIHILGTGSGGTRLSWENDETLLDQVPIGEAVYNNIILSPAGITLQVIATDGNNPLPRNLEIGVNGNTTIPGTLITNGNTFRPVEAIGDAGNPLTVRAGDSETEVGGNLIVRGGDTIGAPGAGQRNGGNFTSRAGSTVEGNGGIAELLGGNTTVGDGGLTYIRSGATTTGDSGNIEIRAGDTVTGNGGSVIIESGETVTGTAGNIDIAAKGTVTGDGGNVNLNGGSAISGNGGAINLTAGDTVGSGDPGTIRLRTFNAAAPQDWTFGFDGGLTFPDATVQTTAFTTDPTLNVLKIDDGVHERFQAKTDATGTVQHNCALGHIFYHTSPDANWTANFTNLNLSSNYATAVTLIIVQGGTGYYPSAVQIGGVGQTLNWQGNTTPTPSTNRTDVVTFSIINNSGTYTVLGQLTGF